MSESEINTPPNQAEIPNNPRTGIRRFLQWFRKLVRARYVLIGLAVVTSIFMYGYLGDIVDTRNNFNIANDIYRLFARDEYKLYSGKPGGFYIRVGQELEVRTANSGRTKIVNHESSGGLANARKVASQKKTFGLVQEDTLAPGDFIRDHLRYVTPLYLERMHIIYDAKAFDEFVNAPQKPNGGEPEQNNSFPSQNKDQQNKKLLQHPISLSVFSASSKNDVKRFFEEKAISTGPVGSGSRLFAGHLLSQCKIGDYTNKSLDFKDALNRLDSNDPDLKVDVVFTIAGAPLKSVMETLEKDGGTRFKLMSIDPLVIAAMNKELGLRLSVASFEDKYNNGEKVSTLGTWAFLVASRDVPDVVISDVLNELDKAKATIAKESNIDGKIHFQLDEFDFHQAFTTSHTGFGRLARNALIFATFVSLMSTIIVVFLTWLLSGVHKVIYYRTLTGIYRQLPENTKLETNENGIPRPIIYKDQKGIITDLVRGISELLGLAKQIRVSYDNGELGIRHYSFLMSTVESLKHIFQSNFVQRLNEYFANYGEYLPDVLRHYYSAGYLSSAGFDELDSRYGQRISDEHAQMASLAAIREKGLPDDFRIFISYRREDSNFAAGRIRDCLAAEFGKHAVFQDIDIPAGRDFRQTINEEISRCDVLLSLIGPRWLSILHERSADPKDYVRHELEAGLEREIPIVPLLLEPAKIPRESDLPESIKEISFRQTVVIRHDPEFQSSMDRLVEAMVESYSDLQRRPRSNRSKKSSGRRKRDLD